MRVCMICQGGSFLGAGRVACSEAACDAWRLLGGFGGMLPRENFLDGAIRCVLEHIFINFLLEKLIKIFIF